MLLLLADGGDQAAAAGGGAKGGAARSDDEVRGGGIGQSQLGNETGHGPDNDEPDRMPDGLDALMAEEAELDAMMAGCDEPEEEDSAGSVDTRYSVGNSSRSSRPFKNKQ
eukprot:SAG22_NODE_8946_length_619_cov_1.338462_1_plen_110_part_00